MLTEEVRNYLLTSVFNAAVRAGGAIMQIYKHRDDYDVTLKSDRTPITVADRAAEEASEDARALTGPEEEARHDVTMSNEDVEVLGE